MSKVVLNNVENLENEQTAVSTINNNSATIQAAFDNTLSRDGTDPNQMEAVLDMNSFDIINLPEPTSNFNPVRLIDINNLATGGTIVVNPLPSGGTTGQVLTKASGANFDVLWANSSSSTGGAVDYPTRAVATVSLVPNNLNTLRVAGYSSINDGGAGIYIKLQVAPSPAKAWHFQSADGAWWQLQANPVVPKQVGAKLDGTTDDTVAIQAWIDYGAAFDVVSFGQAGTAAVPTGKLTVSSGQVIDGGNALTIQRQSNIVDSLIDGTSLINVTVRNLFCDSTAGTSSVSANTIGLTTMNFTVPAGLVGFNTYANNYIQITANSTSSDRINYMIGKINSYTGSTMNVTVTTAVGSGTFSSWLLDSYPQNGNLAQSNIALRFTTSTNVNVENCIVTGRFYNAIDTRNCTDVMVDKNICSGYVNRGIHCSAYNANGSALNNQITYNRLEGGNFSQYGINTSATDGAVAAGFVIHGNRVSGTNFQGIIIGGGLTSSHITDNSIQMTLQTIGAGIILEGIVGTSGNQLPQNISVANNNITLGQVGILVFNVFYCTFTGNTVTGATFGYEFTGSPTLATLYNTVNGNVANGSLSHGFYFTGSGAGGVTGSTVVGNSAIVSGGFGFVSDANTASSNYSGNSAIGNTAGSYSLLGTGNVAGLNL